MDLGKAMSLSGMCVALSAALVYDKKTVVLSVLGTYFNGLVLDHFIFDQNIKRRVCIITGKEEELRRFIIEDLHSGATVYESYGAYNMQKRREIITIVDKAEYQKLMSYMNREDPQAFITVYTVSDMRYRPKGQHRIIPALRLKHRSGGSPRQEPPQAAVALRSASLRLGVRHGICVAKMLDNTQSIICAFGLAAAAPRSPYRHLELCGIAFNFSSAHPPGR